MLNREYKQFSKAAGLREQSDRTIAAVFGKEQSGAYVPVARTFNQHMTLEGSKLPDGTTIHVSEHIVERAVTRNVPVSAAKNALQNPLERTKIKYDNQGRPSYQLIGEKASVSINPDTGVVTSIWPTRTKRAKKLKKRQKP